jgi:hypothetical protein
MRTTLPLLLLLALLLLTLPGAAPEVADEDREKLLDANHHLLAEWQKDPEHAARLRRDLAAFWAFSPEQRQKLRQLDYELHHKDSVTQERLWRVLERYHAWLQRLPASDRQRIEAAGDWRQRLEVVKELREREWISRLPRTQQDQLRSLPEKERKARIASLRQEQHQRQREALQLPSKGGRRDRPIKFNDLPADIQTFVKTSLMPLLTDAEKKRLKDAEGKPWSSYKGVLNELLQKYRTKFPKKPPALPGVLPDGARSALPEVPDRTLFPFLMKELTHQERQRLRLTLGDAEGRERVKQEFFKRHPRELRRLQQLDFRAPSRPSRARFD